MIEEQSGLTAEVRRGKIISFLNVNKFRVEMSGDGRIIDAVMADDLIPKVSAWYATELPRGMRYISVEVQYREPPALPLIIEAYPDALTG
jgi:hypothetical protein